MYVGDDVTDEDVLEGPNEAPAGGETKGIGVFVGSADDPEVGGRTTSADHLL